MAKPKKQNFSNSLNLQPQSTNQSQYIKSLEEYVVSIGLGFAGSGKTFVPTTMAAQALIDHRIDKIVLTRSAKSDSATLGYGPGDVVEKLTPWLMPYISTLRKYFNGAYDKMLADGKIEIIAFEHLQGQSLENAFVLLDEGQFVTPGEMEMFLKRIGKNCTVAISGDLNQAKNGYKSGLAHLLERIEDANTPEFGANIGVTVFDNPDDIIRSDFCREVTIGYDRYHTTKNQ